MTLRAAPLPFAGRKAMLELIALSDDSENAPTVEQIAVIPPVRKRKKAVDAPAPAVDAPVDAPSSPAPVVEDVPVFQPRRRG